MQKSYSTFNAFAYKALSVQPIKACVFASAHYYGTYTKAFFFFFADLYFSPRKQGSISIFFCIQFHVKYITQFVDYPENGN